MGRRDYDQIPPKGVPEDYRRCVKCGVWTPPKNMTGITSRVCLYCIDEVHVQQAFKKERQDLIREQRLERKKYLGIIRNG